MAAILRSIPAEMLSTLRGTRTAQAAWEALEIIRVGVQRAREANAQQLRHEFAALVWKEGETAEDFSVHITGLANNLRILGDDIADSELVRKMLQVVPEHLSQVAISMETLLDLSTISIEEVTGRLRSVEQRRKPPPVLDNQGRLLLCEDDWLAKHKIREGEMGSASGSNAAGKKRGGKPRPRARGNGGARDGDPPLVEGDGPARKTDKCLYCGKYGHWAKDCTSRKRGEAAHPVIGEEDT